MASQPNAAAQDLDPELDIHPDPFAMRPFLGYNLESYINHWEDIGTHCVTPRMFNVNWFRINESDGSFLWPGFGENIRVLEWVFNRCNSSDIEHNALKTPIGYIPKDLNTTCLDLAPNALEELFKIDRSEWEEELVNIRDRIKNMTH